MLWMNFLHIYQPPGQDPAIIRKVANESYRPVLNFLIGHPQIKITLNICGSLTEQLFQYNLTDVLDKIKVLAERKQIELVGSAKYHPILPLIPAEEIIRQIRLNQETNRKFFGSIYQPNGFYFPEMAYSREVAKMIKALGFKWIILDEISYSADNSQPLNFAKFYQVEKVGLGVVFRSRKISDAFINPAVKTKDDFWKIVKNERRIKDVLITAFDGENLGHHRPENIKFWPDLILQSSIQTETISGFIQNFSEGGQIKIRSSSWASNERDLAQGIPYLLWRNPNNPFHYLQWKLIFLTYYLAKRYCLLKNKDVRQKIDEMWHSCQFWWASATPWWDLKFFEKKSKEILSITQNKKQIPLDKRKQLKRIGEEIITLAHRWEESGQVRKIQQAYLANQPYQKYFGGEIYKL